MTLKLIIVKKRQWYKKQNKLFNVYKKVAMKQNLENIFKDIEFKKIQFVQKLHIVQAMFGIMF